MSHPVSVIGAGKTTRRHIAALLNDHHAATPVTSVTIPGSEPYFSDPARFVADWALDLKIPVTLVTEDAVVEDLTSDDYRDAKVLKVPDSVAAVLSTPTVLLAFEESDESTMEHYIREASVHGAEVLDLVDGLWPLTLDEPIETDGVAIQEAAAIAEAQEAASVPEQPAAATEAVDTGADEAQALIKPSEAVSEPHDLSPAEVKAAMTALAAEATRQDLADLELGRAVRTVFRLLAVTK